jgi:hypothetical protein
MDFEALGSRKARLGWLSRIVGSITLVLVDMLSGGMERSIPIASVWRNTKLEVLLHSVLEPHERRSLMVQQH